MVNWSKEEGKVNTILSRYGFVVTEQVKIRYNVLTESMKRNWSKHRVFKNGKYVVRPIDGTGKKTSSRKYSRIGSDTDTIGFKRISVPVPVNAFFYSFIIGETKSTIKGVWMFQQTSYADALRIVGDGKIVTGLYLDSFPRSPNELSWVLRVNKEWLTDPLEAVVNSARRNGEKTLISQYLGVAKLRKELSVHVKKLLGSEERVVVPVKTIIRKSAKNYYESKKSFEVIQNSRAPINKGGFIFVTKIAQSSRMGENKALKYSAIQVIKQCQIGNQHLMGHRLNAVLSMVTSNTPLESSACPICESVIDKWKKIPFMKKQQDKSNHHALARNNGKTMGNEETPGSSADDGVTQYSSDTGFWVSNAQDNTNNGAEKTLDNSHAVSPLDPYWYDKFFFVAFPTVFVNTSIRIEEPLTRKSMIVPYVLSLETTTNLIRLVETVSTTDKHGIVTPLNAWYEVYRSMYFPIFYVSIDKIDLFMKNIVDPVSKSIANSIAKKLWGRTKQTKNDQQ